MPKLNEELLTLEYLAERERRITGAGYATPRWIVFARTVINRGYEVYGYEARQTVSKYLTVKKDKLRFKVRFSNHKALTQRELRKDCDFFVGKTLKGYVSTNDALRAVDDFFNNHERKTT